MNYGTVQSPFIVHFRGLRVYLSPSLSWKGYDPTW